MFESWPLKYLSAREITFVSLTLTYFYGERVRSSGHLTTRSQKWDEWNITVTPPTITQILFFIGKNMA